MATKAKKTKLPRGPRADAQRNRLRLLETAKAVFAQKGSTASLEEIARAADVGIGTLYRHFPNREALIEALYGHEVDQLVASADRLMETQAPAVALRQWLLLFVDYIITKQGMADVLSAIVGSSSYAASGTHMKQTAARLVEAAVASGEVSLDVEPLDLLRALSGVANLSPGPNSKVAAKRLVDILMTGISAPQKPSGAKRPAR
ncbi:MAG TPA: helix-turn-helix domain-containing protein [Rhizomicrobium sp.]|nr:helix-turn-helix domain-containing protein [Rhizomicrobium sp.]